ncbi:hypothetical protein BGZ73_001375 [Actinomortierella ambigua]|nr:hypothetical protein BGZ73_001375 [Actinomortierella ambigua]
MATSNPFETLWSPPPTARFGARSHLPLDIQNLLNQIFPTSMGIAHDFAEMIEKLSTIQPGEKVYVLEQLLSRILGRENVVNDREIPFEKLMGVLATLPKKVSDTIISRLIEEFWKDLEHPTHSWPTKPFRSADGSDYSRLYPHMGKSNTSYARSVTGKSHVASTELPDPQALFRDLLQRPAYKPFEPHPNGVNSLLFCLAGVITHDLFWSDPANPANNLTTHYLDLSHLYGVDKKKQHDVRTMQQGLLKPDAFADPRMRRQLPGIVALMIVLSRNHNYIAQQLLSDAVNAAEDYRFTHVNGKGSPELSPKDRDEVVFQTARLINCACFANLVVSEYLRTILGLSTDSEFTLNPLITPPAANPSSGNVVSIEFAYIYRWHGALSEADVKWLEARNSAQRQAEQRGSSQSASRHQGHGETQAPVSTLSNVNLINILHDSMLSVASSMGARKVPAALEEAEVQGIRSARRVGLCTLNEFRRFFHLKEYTSYQEMVTRPGEAADPDVIAALEKHYGPNGINRVELYPGVVIEATKADGLALPYTASRAILSDAVNLLRNDRFYAEGMNPQDLTTWGYEYATGKSMFRRMVLQALPEWHAVIKNPVVAEGLLRSPFRVPNFNS